MHTTDIAQACIQFRFKYYMYLFLLDGYSLGSKDYDEIRNC